MKVISTGSARVNCEQCGSTLEYEWRDITEYNGNTCVFCPVCGLSIEVPENVNPKPHADLHNCTIDGVVGLFDSCKTQTMPYDIFQRDALYASNGSVCNNATGALSTSATKVKTDDACTLTVTI